MNAIQNIDSRKAARLALVQALYQMELSGQGVKAVARHFPEYGFLPDQNTGEGIIPVLKTTGTETESDGQDSAQEVCDSIEQEQSDNFPFFQEMLEGVVASQKNIDSAIGEVLAKGWRLERLNAVLRAVLRGGAYELFYRPDIPVRVVISEYLALTDAFFDDPEPKFVNAALEKIARKARPRDFKGS